MTDKLKFNESSFYYIAAGFDWEPMLRFSHLCTHFFYANLYYTKAEVLQHLQKDLKDSNFLKILSIKEHDDFDEVTHFDLHPNFRQHFNQASTAFTATEKQNYTEAFVPALKEKQWLLEIDIMRTGEGRPLKLYYFTGEGLASYIALSHNGACPPKVLCTIQTEVLEKSNRLMQRFLLQTEQLPLLWVRGMEADQFYSKSECMGDDQLYSEKGMGFNFAWEVNTSYLYNIGPNTITTKRYCKGYLTKASLETIQATPFKTYANGNRIVQGNLQDVLPATITKKTMVMIPRALRHLLPEKSDLFHVSYWDNLLDGKSKESFRIGREFIRMDANMLDFEEVYFTLFGLEDEGQVLDGLFQYDYPAKMIAVVKDPMDLYDLRDFKHLN